MNRTSINSRSRSRSRLFTHFKEWYTFHETYLKEMWFIFNEEMEDNIQEPVQFNYSEFVDFVYCHSSKRNYF